MYKFHGSTAVLCRIAYVEYDSGDRQAAEAAGDELLGDGAS
jgi:hypothetical protein